MSSRDLTDYTRLVAGLVHDFRTPLGSIVGAASTLDEYADVIDGETRSKLCGGIIHGAQHLDHLLTGLATLAKARSPSVGDERDVELNDLLQGMSAELQGRHVNSIKITLQSQDIMICGDPAMVRAMILAMFDLAGGFAPDGADAAFSLVQVDGDAQLRMESPVRKDSTMLLKSVLNGAGSDDRMSANVVFVAAIREVVHILGGQVSFQHDEGAMDLSQTVSLPIPCN